MSYRYDLEKLIDLFACHGVAEIEKKNGKLLKKTLGIKKYKDLMGDEKFQKDFIKLKEHRQNLDDLGGDENSRERVVECLRLLRETVENGSPGDEELLCTLIEKGMYPGWKKDDRSYFDTGKEMLTAWKDFFLSYTNRNLRETNHDFKEVLQGAFGENEFNNIKEKVNGLARLIAKYLVQNNLTHFFDQRDLKCGDELEEKVFNHCRAAFSFVQIIEPETFRKPGTGAKNWCYEEFRTFGDWCGKNQHKRFYFTLTHRDVFPARMPKLYKEWQKKINDRLHIQNLQGLDKDEIRLKVKEIAEEIETAKTKLLDGYIQ